MKASALFITDPLCSWCWGTLPEIDRARQTLASEVDFDLVMGGLQIGHPDGMTDFDKRHLRHLWRQVTEVTGREFSGQIPEGFIYHSEIACRAVEIARRAASAPPWAFFSELQAAFYDDGRDINRSDVLAMLLDIPEPQVVAMLSDPHIIDSTRSNFALAEALSANALPGIYLDTGVGHKLVCGGYVTAEQLVIDIRQRLG